MQRNRILIAIDGSACSREALETGLAVARESGAVATLVCVRQAPSSLLGAPFYQSALSDELGWARTVVAEAEARAAELGVETESEILEGHAAGRILDLARARDARLIVVGSRGRSKLAGVLLGSVSTEVLHKADRPVLVAKQRSRVRRLAA